MKELPEIKLGEIDLREIGSNLNKIIDPFQGKQRDLRLNSQEGLLIARVNAMEILNILAGKIPAQSEISREIVYQYLLAQDLHGVLAKPKLRNASEQNSSNESIFVDYDLTEKIIQKLGWILNPEVLFSSDEQQMFWEAFSRARFRAGDILALLTNHLSMFNKLSDFPHEHFLDIEEISNFPKLDRDWPGIFAATFASSKDKFHPID